MDRVYKCLACGSADVNATEKAYVCDSCGAAYPVRNGVPLFLRHVAWRRSGARLGDDTARAVCRAVGIEPTPDKVAGLLDVLAWNYDLPDFGLSAENNYFLERVRGTLLATGVPADDIPAGRAALKESHADCPVNEDVRAAFVGHYFPESLRPRRTVSRNVRLTNTGRSVISSRGRAPVTVAYHWRGADGRVLVWEGVRTALVIDLYPGRTLTLPVLVKTPNREGRAYLELTLVREGQRWLDETAAVLPVELRRDADDAPPGHWRVFDRGNDNYAADHALGRDMVLAELRRRGGSPRLLEIGGCCHPQMEGTGGELFNVDIDVQTLQVGALAPRRGAGAVHFVAADAADPPFVDGCFDGIVLFATLHHFADPAAVLGRLRPLLKPDGFLAVMCEPCGHARVPKIDPNYLRELEQGINEQSFSPEEYAQIFGEAGFEATELVVHFSSLKALLRPARAAPRRRLAPLRAPDVLPARPAGGPGRLRRLWARLRRAA